MPVLTTGASTASPVCFDVTLHANGQTPVRCQEIVNGTSPARSGIVSSGQCLLDVRSPENRPRGQEEAVLPSEDAPSTNGDLAPAGPVAVDAKAGSRSRRRHRRRVAAGTSSKATESTGQNNELQAPEDPPHGLRREVVAPSENSPSTTQGFGPAAGEAKEKSPKSDDKGSGSKSRRRSKSRKRRHRHRHAQTATPWTSSPDAQPQQRFDSTWSMDVTPGSPI